MHAAISELAINSDGDRRGQLSRNVDETENAARGRVLHGVENLSYAGKFTANFKRLQSDEIRRGEGTAQGLAFVKEPAEHMESTIERGRNCGRFVEKTIDRWMRLAHCAWPRNFSCERFRLVTTGLEPKRKRTSEFVRP